MPNDNRDQFAVTADRRCLLKALAASGMLGMAGCSGGRDGGDDGSDGSEGDDADGGNSGDQEAAFWHDKPDWNGSFETSFDEIEDETGVSVEVTSYGDTDSFQGALRPVFGTSDGPEDSRGGSVSAYEISQKTTTPWMSPTNGKHILTTASTTRA